MKLCPQTAALIPRFLNSRSSFEHNKEKGCEKMKSIWQDYGNMPKFGRLDSDISVDVLVIGGGLAGLLSLWELKKRGADAALIEADTLLSHTSGSTTAKITVGHSLIYSKIKKKYGLPAARLYLSANESALEKYRTLSKSIDCDFEEKDNFVYSVDDSEPVLAEYRVLSELGYPAEFTEKTELPFKVAGAVVHPKSAQFNPIKFAAKIADGARIFEGTRALNIMNGRVITSGGTVAAKNIIVATHFPIINRIGLFYMKMYQSRSYVIAVKTDSELPGMYVNAEDKGISLRSYRGHLLIGGSGHRSGTGGGFSELTDFNDKYIHGKITHRFTAEDCIPLDSIPYIGSYSKIAKNIYTATGFNKWGMTSSMLAAEILADKIQGRANEYAELFSPQRSMASFRLLSNGAHTAKSLVMPKSPRCPHLGCALKWNKEERVFDCPCHGSRFSEDGELIDGPANKELNING